MKFQNAECSCGFDLSSAEPELFDETYPGEYLGHCPSCGGQAQPVVEGEPGSEPERRAPARRARKTAEPGSESATPEAAGESVAEEEEAPEAEVEVTPSPDED